MDFTRVESGVAPLDNRFLTGGNLTRLKLNKPIRQTKSLEGKAHCLKDSPQFVSVLSRLFVSVYRHFIKIEVN